MDCFYSALLKDLAHIQLLLQHIRTVLIIQVIMEFSIFSIFLGKDGVKMS